MQKERLLENQYEYAGRMFHYADRMLQVLREGLQPEAPGGFPNVDTPHQTLAWWSELPEYFPETVLGQLLDAELARRELTRDMI